MISKYKSSHKYKRINYILKTIDLFLELIIDLRYRKTYLFFKKPSKINEKFNFSKHDLKKLSILISSNKIYRKKLIFKISKFIFKTKKTIKESKIFNKIMKIFKHFVDSFFDLKQIIKC